MWWCHQILFSSVPSWVPERETSRRVPYLGSKDGAEQHLCRCWPEIPTHTKQSQWEHSRGGKPISVAPLLGSFQPPCFRRRRRTSGSQLHPWMSTTNKKKKKHAFQSRMNLSGLFLAQRWWALLLRRLLLCFRVVHLLNPCFVACDGDLRKEMRVPSKFFLKVLLVILTRQMGYLLCSQVLYQNSVPWSKWDSQCIS
jgi:hypothetical protein